jgi:uncharacterized protein YecE (DUF72 family)
MERQILIGVSGWSYPDWRGVVYPKGCKDELRFLAALVDFLEVNVSFYRVPDPQRTASWVERVAELSTKFTAKLPQAVTHEGRIEAETVRGFAAAMTPLREAGRLTALLAQFSYRLEADAEAFAHLRAIERAFGEIAPLVLEVRHRSWRARDAQTRAAESGFRLVHLDWPGMQSGFVSPFEDLPQPPGPTYLRLHGRNTRAWFDKQAGRDATYDWLYGPAQVDELETRIGRLAQLAATGPVLVAANNHFRGQAPKVALELLARVHRAPVEVPPTLIRAFPDLAPIARHAQGELF